MEKESVVVTPVPAEDSAETVVLCVTQDPRERAAADPAFLDVCTGVGEHIVCSTACEGTGCGGHPICTPCRDLAAEKGYFR